MVTEAADGDTALGYALSEAPDLVVLDLMLPRRSGWSVIEELKRNGSTRDIPVLVLSAFAHLFVAASPAPPDAVVSKPFDIHELLDQVGSLMLARSAAA